jgi:lipopolysaccharide/colanic/teichoic acid biosynthesis glycosyltransferase
MWKRGIDLSVVILTLPIWLPIMLFIACGIQLVSPGSVFFRQERIGYRGRRFVLYKFRSMRTDIGTSVHERHCGDLIRANRPMTKLDEGDRRIIPLGRLLRASGLDELPQIFNILLGDMSLVGPRPCTPHEFSWYEPWQRARFEALPGLTGYWQVHGKNKTTFSQMIDMDIHYTRSMSFTLDLSIMLMTFPTVVGQLLEVRRNKGRGAKQREAATRQLSQIEI